MGFLVRVFLMVMLLCIYRKFRVRMWRLRQPVPPWHDSIYGGE